MEILTTRRDLEAHADYLAEQNAQLNALLNYLKQQRVYTGTYTYFNLGDIINEITKQFYEKTHKSAK